MPRRASPSSRRARHTHSLEQPVASIHLFPPVRPALTQASSLTMSHRAVDFVHMWISANVHPNDIIEERRDVGPKEYAARCQTHARLVGISSVEIRESYSDLECLMMEAIETERRSPNWATSR